MGKKSSAFERLVREQLPPGAHYYYLVRYGERGQWIRVPERGAFQATPRFQAPTAKPGVYIVEFCRDRDAKRLVKSRHPSGVLARVSAQDTARVRCEAEYRRFLTEVIDAAPDDATHYYLTTVDGTEGPDGLLKLWSRFEYPALAAMGWWEVRYCDEHASPCAAPARPVLVALREPVANRDATQQSTRQSDTREDLLSLLDRHYELNCELRSTLRTLADQWSRIEGHYQRAAVAPDYTAVLKYLADSFREALRPPMGTVPVAQPVKSNDCAGKPAAGSVSTAAAVAAVEAATLQAIAEVTKSAAQPKPSSLEDAKARVDAQREALTRRDPDFRLNRAHLIELERKPT